MAIAWGTYRIEDTDLLSVRFARHQIAIRTFETGLNIHHSLHDSDDDFEAVVLSEKESCTFDDALYTKYFALHQNEVELLPNFPAKAVLIKPERVYRLLPKQQIDTFVAIPLCLNILTQGRKGLLLETYGGESLLDAWFGDENGEACFWHETSFLFGADLAKSEADLIYIPLSLSNISDEVLEVEKFLIRHVYLNIYHDGQRLLTDQLSIRFRGVGNESLLSFDKPSASKLARYELVHEAVKGSVDQLIKKSFDFFKSMY